MARVELRPSGGHEYAVVVEDVRAGDGWKKNVIRSFGNAANAENVRKAHEFANAVNAGTYLRALGMTNTEIKQALSMAVGAAALTLVVAWLVKQE